VIQSDYIRTDTLWSGVEEPIKQVFCELSVAGDSVLMVGGTVRKTELGFSN
jgi:hypothetical protein